MSFASTFPSVTTTEEWPDAEFDFPDGDPIQASDVESEKEDEEDWDVEMDLGKTGGAKAHATLEEMAARCVAARSEPFDKHSRLVTIRPPVHWSTEDDDDDGEGISTIKVSALPKSQASKPAPATIDEDFEDDFIIPSELTELSLRPTPLAHRSSKSSMEWGDRDHTVSSQSSDAFSTFGFTDNSTPSSCTSASLPETETEDEDAEDILDGLVLPSDLFESGQGAKRLAKLLEKKKTAFTPVPVIVPTPDPEDDFEAGLVLDDDMELSPSRLMLKAQNAQVASGSTRSKSVPARMSAPLRPPSRLRGERARSPNYPPVSSIQQFRKLPAPPPSLLLPSSSIRTQTYSQAVVGASSTSSQEALSPKSGSLRTQKSHSGLKPASPPSTRRLTRKASLPAFSDSSSAQASGSGSSYAASGPRYDAPTASSRAKIHTHSTSRISALDYKVPPTRPTTPSANPVALRLTMPTSSSRLKARAPISAVFPQSITGGNAPTLLRSTSPLPPPQQLSVISGGRTNPSPTLKPRLSQNQIPVVIPTPKFLKRPKRLKTYGDGTELDDFEDLPLDREKEGRYRVQPKGYGTRVPGSSFVHKDEANANTIKVDRFSLGRASKQDLTTADNVASAKTLKRTGHLGLASSKPPQSMKKKKRTSATTRRKPTLIRNLGGSSAPKVVGDMKWNPQTLRWEGNDQVLRDFDAVVGTSVRPALITQLTGSSVGSPGGNLASGARVVGNMFFDPARMCWISTLPPEEDEPDVFADLADDEDDEWEARGATIRPGQQQSSSTEKLPPSLSRTRSKSMSEPESDRCSRGSMVYDVEDGFVDKCRLAEERHRSDMKGWVPPRSRPSSDPDRVFLYEIRALATRQY